MLVSARTTNSTKDWGIWHIQHPPIKILEEIHPLHAPVVDARVGGLKATYDDHLRLIGKRVVDFLLMLTELFFATCYGWSATSGYRFKIDDFAPTGAGWPKILGRRSPPPTILLLRKLSKWCFVWHKNLESSFFRFVTIHAFDRQADGRTERQMEGLLIARPRLHSMQRDKNGDSWVFQQFSAAPLHGLDCRPGTVVSGTIISDSIFTQ